VSASQGDEQKASPYVTRKLRECDAAIVAAAPRVLASGATNADANGAAFDDDAVHDLRVAIRRMRTLLKMSRALYGRWHADVVRRALADVMRATGELRDEEVLEETLDGASPDPAFARWLAARKTRERKLRRSVVARLERGDLDRARLLLKALLVFPVPPRSDLPLAKFARRTVERARRRVEARRDVSPDDVLGLHELRIAYKELRYSIELLADALPIDERVLLEPAAVFQKRLGELHDADVAIEVVREAKALPAHVRHDALEALRSERERRLAKYLRELDPLAAARVAAAPSPGPSPGPNPDPNAAPARAVPAGEPPTRRRDRATKP
jgi:CHAD domain-containing protein